MSESALAVHCRSGTATHRNGPGSAAHRGSNALQISIAAAAMRCARDTCPNRLKTQSRLPQQAGHQRREPDLPLALEPLGREDHSHLRKGAVDVVIENDVI